MAGTLLDRLQYWPGRRSTLDELARHGYSAHEVYQDLITKESSCPPSEVERFFNERATEYVSSLGQFDEYTRKTGHEKYRSSYLDALYDEAKRENNTAFPHLNCLRSTFAPGVQKSILDKVEMHRREEAKRKITEQLPLEINIRNLLKQRAMSSGYKSAGKWFVKQCGEYSACCTVDPARTAALSFDISVRLQLRHHVKNGRRFDFFPRRFDLGFFSYSIYNGDPQLAVLGIGAHLELLAVLSRQLFGAVSE